MNTVPAPIKGAASIQKLFFCQIVRLIIKRGFNPKIICLFVCLFVTEVTCTATSVDGLRLRKGATTRELGQSPRNMSAIDGK